MSGLVQQGHQAAVQIATSKYDAAGDATNAAWAAVRVYYIALIPSAIGIILSAIIAWTAITAPNRERHTRDLETRKARARLYGRAAIAGRRALKTLAYAERYLESHLSDEVVRNDPLERMMSRLDMRIRVIEHFLSLSLRDIDLVELLVETSALLSEVRRKIGCVVDDPTVTLRSTSRLLRYKKTRRAKLLSRFLAINQDMKAKDVSLEQDLRRVWSAKWFNPFHRDQFFIRRAINNHGLSV